MFFDFKIKNRSSDGINEKILLKNTIKKVE